MSASRARVCRLVYSSAYDGEALINLSGKQGQNFTRVLAIFPVATDVTPHLKGVSLCSHLVSLLGEMRIVIGDENRNTSTGRLLRQLGKLLLFVEVETTGTVAGEVGRVGQWNIWGITINYITVVSIGYCGFKGTYNKFRSLSLVVKGQHFFLWKVGMLVATKRHVVTTFGIITTQAVVAVTV